MPDFLGEGLSVLATHDVGEHGVAGALVPAQTTLVVRLHLGVTLREELLDVSETHHRVVTLPDPLLETDGNLYLGRRRVRDGFDPRHLLMGIDEAPAYFVLVFCFYGQHFLLVLGPISVTLHCLKTV